MERTLLIIKPDAVEKSVVGEILSRLEKENFKIVAIKSMQMTPHIAKQFYLVHKDKEFYNSLVNFMTSGKVFVVCLERENAVKHLRDFIGNTDPEKAKTGTIRKDFGTSIERNAVHASDSFENAVKEIKFMFSDFELL